MWKGLPRWKFHSYSGEMFNCKREKYRDIVLPWNSTCGTPCHNHHKARAELRCRLWCRWCIAERQQQEEIIKACFPFFSVFAQTTHNCPQIKEERNMKQWWPTTYDFHDGFLPGNGSVELHGAQQQLRGWFRFDHGATPAHQRRRNVRLLLLVIVLVTLLILQCTKNSLSECAHLHASEWHNFSRKLIVWKSPWR